MYVIFRIETEGKVHNEKFVTLKKTGHYFLLPTTHRRAAALKIRL